ncbi:hypothetical protein R1sor_011348 [Riccia sorocarpa]|uniref:F-box domain-containing protein n=1 Tax=Riccia sorocarpa TaxID=122646 RepID=A0ABD3I4F6_9MARC
MSPHPEFDPVEQGDPSESYWPLELLQMVFCRIPFLSMMIVPQISPRWRSVFANAVRSADPDQQGRIFKAEVMSSSVCWPAFCPLFTVVDPAGSKFWAYNQSSGVWQEIPDHQSYRHPSREFVFRRASGPLICSVEIDKAPVRSGNKRPRKNWTQTEENKGWEFVVSVVNVFTGSRRDLPPLPHAGMHLKYSDRCANDSEFRDRNRLPQFDFHSCPQEVIFHFDSDAQSYKVYVLYDLIFRGQFGGTVIYEFHSTRAHRDWVVRWNDARIEGQLPDVKRTNSTHLDGIRTSTAYVDGVVYYMTVNPVRVWKYDVRAESWAWPTILAADPARGPEGKFRAQDAWGIVVVDSHLMVVTVGEKLIRVYSVDRETLLLTSIFSRAIHTVFLSQHYRLVSYSRFIVFWPDEAFLTLSALALDLGSGLLTELALPRELQQVHDIRVALIDESLQIRVGVRTEV